MTERTNSKFLKAVRYAQIAAPHTRDFTADRWRQNFQKLASGSPDEDRVYSAGLWVGGELKKLWAVIEELPYFTNSHEEIIKALMRFSYSFAFETEKLYSFSSDDTQDMFRGASRFKGATFDQRLVLLGDTLARTLAYVFSIPPSGHRSNPLAREEAALILQMFSRIYSLEFMMGRVIWCNWEMGIDGGPKFRPSDSAFSFANNEAIAQNIQDMSTQEFVGIAALRWRDGWGRHLCPEHLELNARSGSSAIFQTVNEPPENMPEHLPLLIRDAPDWLAEVLQFPLPTLGGVHFGAILRAWSTLNNAFRLIVEYDLDKHSPGEILETMVCAAATP